ncbi:MAG: sulfotransferase domain-containing protein [Bacteroidota bacterium]
MSPQHVLILGCGRSGTSIFGELFQHLPQYRYYSEPPFTEVLQLDHLQPAAVKVPRESEGFPSDSGLSFPMSTLTETLSPLRIFWQVRHPLDTICSLKIGISRNWGHHPRPPDWQRWLDRPLIEQCAHHWNYINSVGFTQVKELAVMTRFEDMIADSLAFARSVGEIIDLDVSSNEPFLKQWAERVQNQNNEKFVEAETSRAYSTRDHSVKVGRWRENLSNEELRLALPIIQETANRFDYEVK